MKLLHLWPVAAIPLGAPFVIPNQQVFSDLRNNDLKDDIWSSLEPVQTTVSNVLDNALESANNAWRATAAGASGAEQYWLNDFFNRRIDDDADNLPKELDQVSPVYRLFPPRHPPSNKTVYELIAESKYTTILAKIINEDDELVRLLNSTQANHTVFAPTDDAFKKIPHHDDHHPPKELIRAVIRYHVTPGVYNAAQIFHSHTLPTVVEDSSLGHGLPQRLAVRVGWKGLTVNFYSHIVAIDIAGSNGIIHGIDSILIPPPRTCTLLEIVPTQFSTFVLGVLQSGLVSDPDVTPQTLSLSTILTSALGEHHHHGGTIFAPSNAAFQKLGLKINAFLFSPCGHKYLRALLQYHVVPNRTLYSDVFYTADGQIKPFGVKGFTHLDLPTLLGDRSLAIDVARYGPYASLKINGYQRVAFADALARDGNVHIVDHVLIPPRRVGDDSAPDWTGEEDEITVEDLKRRLGDWVEGEEPEDEKDEKDEKYGGFWGRGVEL